MKKPSKPKVPKKPKILPTEEELVKRYANRVIKNAIYHGRVDTEKFKGMEHTHSVSKNLWMDTDFFFSVVFQSSDQKHEFIKAVKWETDLDEQSQIQIINGPKLAEMMGIKLKSETTKEFPLGNLALLPFVLDDEETETK